MPGTSPTLLSYKATAGSSVPCGLLSAGLSQDSNAPPPGRHLELRRFWRRVCSCSRRRLSSLTGLGMKPTSQPSFTSRPIHQSLLYFCEQETNRETRWEAQPPSRGTSRWSALPVDGSLKPPSPLTSASDESVPSSKTMPRPGPSPSMDHRLLEEGRMLPHTAGEHSRSESRHLHAPGSDAVTPSQDSANHSTSL